MSHKCDIPESMSWSIYGRVESGHTQRDKLLEWQKKWHRRLWNPFQETGHVQRLPGEGHPRATTANNDRYILLTARRDRTANATQIQRQFFFGKRKKGLKPNHLK
ncbi:hypothetical protein TNCV_261421 [Trichonephila clavipes]|nr:hypothetical protein TNCV_261421 [Trichonephila clavipes]